jgi:phage tail-like protein
MAQGMRSDPLGSFRFLVEIDGLVVGGFTEIGGLNAETETEDYREGGVNTFVHKLPKLTKYPPLSFKRGLASSDVLWRWYWDAVNGSVTRRNGSILVLDHTGAESWRWNFYQAYPVKWKGPDLRSDQSLLAFETIELAHNGFSKEG